MKRFFFLIIGIIVISNTHAQELEIRLIKEGENISGFVVFNELYSILRLAIGKGDKIEYIITNGVATDPEKDDGFTYYSQGMINFEKYISNDTKFGLIQDNDRIILKIPSQNTSYSIPIDDDIIGSDEDIAEFLDLSNDVAYLMKFEEWDFSIFRDIYPITQTYSFEDYEYERSATWQVTNSDYGALPNGIKFMNFFESLEMRVDLEINDKIHQYEYFTAGDIILLDRYKFGTNNPSTGEYIVLDDEQLPIYPFKIISKTASNLVIKNLRRPEELIELQIFKPSETELMNLIGNSKWHDPISDVELKFYDKTLWLHKIDSEKRLNFFRSEYFPDKTISTYYEVRNGEIWIYRKSKPEKLPVIQMGKKKIVLDNSSLLNIPYSRLTFQPGEKESEFEFFKKK